MCIVYTIPFLEAHSLFLLLPISLHFQWFKEVLVILSSSATTIQPIRKEGAKKRERTKEIIKEKVDVFSLQLLGKVCDDSCT